MLQVVRLLNEMRHQTKESAETYKLHGNHSQAWFFFGALDAINSMLHMTMKVNSLESLLEALYGKLFIYKHEGYGDWQRGRVHAVKYIIEWVENRATLNG